MDNEVITDLEQVSPMWLTGVLAGSGALTRGEVAGFEVDSGRGNWSANARLRLQYSPEAQGELPERLFLKMVNTDLGVEFFDDSEVLYYTRDYLGVAEAPLVRCYHAAYSAERYRYHLLLDDLTQTHITATEKPLTLGYALALAEGLAAMHARWWGADRLREAAAPLHEAAFIRRFVEIAEPGVGHILKAFTAELQPGWPEAMRTLYAQHPQAIIRRSEDLNGFTLIHGDAGDYNILVPREGDRPLYLIDRQPFDWSLTTWLGVYDLAYVMVLNWEIEDRRRWEIPVLQRYHQQLLAHGVQGYPWERLWDDYRLMVPMGVYIATEYCRGGVIDRLTQYWLPMLKQALTACDDLAVSELW